MRLWRKMSMKQVIKIQIVENDEDYIWLLRKELEQHERLEIIGVCTDGEQAVETARRLKPDIVLMDLHLGNSYEEGIRASKEIRIKTDAKVLILTALYSRTILENVLSQSFASGYIMKDQLPLLVENIYALAEGGTGQERILLQAALSCLTAAERAVFDIMMGEENRSHSSTKTIANQKTQVLKKLKLDNKKDLQHVFGALKEEKKK